MRKLKGIIKLLVQEFQLTMGRISGLDPAQPHFAKAARPVRLDRSAAKYVDVIHTDANQFITGSLGIIESIGNCSLIFRGFFSFQYLLKNLWFSVLNGKFYTMHLHYLTQHNKSLTSKANVGV